MTVSRTLWKLLPQPVRETPADLVAVIGAVVATNVAVFAPIVRETAVRIPLGLAFVLFVPGYALVAALFPEGRDSGVGNEGSETDETTKPVSGRLRSLPSGETITGVERLILAFALSFAIVPLLGLAIDFSPWPVHLRSLTVALSGFTLGTTGVAVSRRQAYPPQERFRVSDRQWTSAIWGKLFGSDSRADAALNLLVIASLLLALGGVGYAVTTPQQGETFSSVYVLNEDDGELVSSDYPSSFDENRRLMVGLENHEHRPIEYTVVVVAQELESDDGQVVEQTELQRFGTRLEHGETWRHPHEVETEMTDETVRIAWLVYTDGDVPEDPSLENAEYSSHLWGNASES